LKQKRNYRERKKKWGERKRDSKTRERGLKRTSPLLHSARIYSRHIGGGQGTARPQ